VRGEQAPNPDSRVRLSAEGDALGNRRGFGKRNQDQQDML
jgi:hypothetical protein